MDMYTPIDGQLGEIRVLTVFPGHRDDPIRCSIRICSLTTDQKPSYRALSYAWGTEMAEQPITVDGHARIITSSLYSALRSLREHEDAITLWTDALCINQEDLVEKMHQIGQMKKIYREADRVVVWLGEHNEAEKVVVSLNLGTEDGNRALMDIGDAQCEIGRPYARFGPVQELLDREWWRRIWVVQEVVAALDQPLVRCGAIDTAWDHWHSLAVWVPYTSFKSHNNDFCRVVARLRAGDMLEYADVCGLVRNMQATEPRDKIFALLAFVDCNLPEPMQADYSLPVSTVYCKFTMREICDKNNLCALRVRQSGRGSQGSSWAIGPCGVESSVLCHWVFSFLHDPDAPPQELGPTNRLYSNPLRYAAITEDLRPLVRWSADCTTMFARGAVVDHINKCLSTLYGETYDHPCLFDHEDQRQPWLKPPMAKWRRTFTGKWSMGAFFEFSQPVRMVFAPQERSGLRYYFYRTRNGKFVFGDPDFRAGDKICLLYGGGTDAFILRDYGGYHRLIGCAYVEGMEDALIFQCLYDEKDIVEFEIR